MDLKSLDPRSFSLGTIHHNTEHLLQRRGPIWCCRVSVYHFSSGKSSALPFHFDTLVHYGRNLELPFERLQQSQISLTQPTLTEQRFLFPGILVLAARNVTAWLSSFLKEDYILSNLINMHNAGLSEFFNENLNMCFLTSLISHCFCLSPISKCCVSSRISSRVNGCVSPRWCRVWKSKQDLLQFSAHFIEQLNHQKVTKTDTKLHFILINSPWIPKPDSILKFLQINPIILAIKWSRIIRTSVRNNMLTISCTDSTLNLTSSFLKFPVLQ